MHGGYAVAKRENLWFQVFTVAPAGGSVGHRAARMNADGAVI